MKKIVISANTSWNIYNFRSELIELLSKFYEIHIITPDDLYKKLLKENTYFRWHKVALQSKSLNIIDNFLSLFKYYNTLRRVDPDIYISYTIKPCIFGIISLIFRRKTSIIINITGLGSLFTNKKYYYYKLILILFYKFFKKRISYVIVQNQSDRRYFIKNNIFDINQIILIPSSGIDTNYFCPKSLLEKKEKYKFIFLSRIKIEKGIIIYLNAIKKFLKNKNNIADFYIAGNFDEDAKLKSKVLEFTKFNENVFYIGSTNNSKKLLEELDIFVLPSYREGMSRALLEAMSMQKIVIGSNKPGVKNLIKDNVNGFIMKKFDADSLFKEFERVYKLNTNQINKITFNARKTTIDNYHITIINLRIINLIQRLN